MLRGILSIIFEHPLLAFIFMVDLFLIIFILSYVLAKFFESSKPHRKLAFFLKKMTLKLHPGEIEEIEDLYGFVIDAYVKKGILQEGDGRGFRAREKILKSISGKEKEVVERIFDYYELKKYGGGVKNEKEVVADLLSAFRSL